MLQSSKLLTAVVLALLSTVPIRAETIVLTIDPARVQKSVPPGAVGWGAMWKREMLWPPPGRLDSDDDHQRYLERLAAAGKPLAEAADLRNISWPWGVSFSTWGVNWENSAKPWSQRPSDCARIALLNRGSGWCEKTVVGVGDLIRLAQAWELEAITVAVPLAVLDGTRVRWGPHFISHQFDPPTMDRIVAHARGLVDYMSRQLGWRELDRVYLAAGCEWRHYGQRQAVLSYAELIRRLRAAIPETKITIVASASDSADLEAFKANSWNRPLYEALKDTPGVAVDLHRYRGMVGLTPDAAGATALSPENFKRLLRTGVTQRRYFSVEPSHWGRSGPALPSVLLENAIHGLIGDHATTSREPWPWAAVMAHADLVREALASSAQTFLGWTWFPEILPREWPHGALLDDGSLATHARAQAFLSRFHRGAVLASALSSEDAVRANVVRGDDGVVRAYGGNFDLAAHALVLKGVPSGRVAVEFFSSDGLRQRTWDPSRPLPLPAMSLWRLTIERAGP